MYSLKYFSRYNKGKIRKYKPPLVFYKENVTFGVTIHVFQTRFMMKIIYIYTSLEREFHQLSNDVLFEFFLFDRDEWEPENIS